MNELSDFFDLSDPDQGLRRELAPGVNARIFEGGLVQSEYEVAG